MVRRASPSPLSRAQTWLAGQNAAAVPEEDEDREDADRTNRSVAQKQPNQLLRALLCHCHQITAIAASAFYC